MFYFQLTSIIFINQSGHRSPHLGFITNFINQSGHRSPHLGELHRHGNNQPRDGEVREVRSTGEPHDGQIVAGVNQRQLHQDGAKPD